MLYCHTGLREKFDLENIPGMFAERLSKFTNISSYNVKFDFKMVISANMSSYLTCWLILS